MPAEKTILKTPFYSVKADKGCSHFTHSGLTASAVKKEKKCKSTDETTLLVTTLLVTTLLVINIFHTFVVGNTNIQNMATENPFVFGKAVEGSLFIDRTEETKRLTANFT